MQHPAVPARAPTEASGPAPPRGSIFRRLLWQSLLLTFIAVGLLGTLSFIVADSLLQNSVLSQLSNAVTQRENLLADAAAQDRERTVLVSSRPQWKEALASADAAARLARLFAELSQQGVPVEGLTLFGPDRRPLAAAGARSPVPLFAVPSAVLVPFIDAKRGWNANDVYAPIAGGGGYLGLRFRVDAVLQNLLAADSIGRSGQVSLGRAQGGELVVIQRSQAEPLHDVVLGSLDDPFLSSLPLSKAVQGEEGVGAATDERGRGVLAAYRYVPSLGWGLTLQIDQAEALGGVRLFGFTLLLLGAALLGLSGVLAFLAARRLTEPLLELSRKMTSLRPGHWDFDRSVRTGDEVEVLDRVAADLTARLRQTYEHLEEEVAKRTTQLHDQYVLDRTILETVDYGIVTTDGEGIVTDVNPAALSLLRFAREDLVGTRAQEKIAVLRKHVFCEPQEHPIAIALQNRIGYRSRHAMHTSIECKDHTLLPCIIMATPLLQDDRLLGSLLVFQDMTEERQIDYMKSEFISLASHQLRTPLSSIRWYVELLGGERAALTSDQGEYLSEIDAAAQRMADLIEALLKVARLEGGGITLDRHSTNLSDILERIVGEWQATAKEHAIKLMTSLPLHPVRIETDAMLLEIILQNFFTNALKYAPKTKQLWFSMEEGDREVRLSLRDEGVGIPATEQQRVFQKFFRAHNVRQMDTDGNGLGLYMCKSIVEKLGGRIWFQSEEGKGTEFSIALPAGA